MRGRDLKRPLSLFEKFMLFIGVGSLCFVLVVAALFFSIGNDMCGNEIYSEISSPNKSKKAVVFQRDCGATTWFSTQISVIDIDDELPNDSANTFAIKNHPETTKIELEWLDDNTLKIQRRINGSEYLAETSVGWFNKVKIVYD